MEKVLQTWLDHQCGMLPGSSYAVLMTGPPDKGPYNENLFWPEYRPNNQLLSNVANLAFYHKKPFIKSYAIKGGNTIDHPDVLACPLFLQGKLFGVVAIEFAHQSSTNLRETVKQVVTGIRWLRAMIKLQSEPELETRKRDKRFSKKSVFDPVQSMSAKILGSRPLPLKIGVGLIAAFFVTFILAITISNLPNNLKLKGIIRQSIKTPQQRNNIGDRMQLDNQDSDGRVATLDYQETLIQQQKPKGDDAYLPSGAREAQIGTKQSKATTFPILSKKKSSSAISPNTIHQRVSNFESSHGLNPPVEKRTNNPSKELYSMEIGPIIKEQELKGATNILHSNGFDCRQVMGIGKVKVIRLLEGLYPRDIAKKRFKEIKSIVKSPFIISEKGKYAIYVATYHDHTKAVEKIIELSEKNIHVDAVATEIPMKGTILVINDVDIGNIETITDQMSRMGFPVKLTKSG